LHVDHALEIVNRHLAIVNQHLADDWVCESIQEIAAGALIIHAACGERVETHIAPAGASAQWRRTAAEGAECHWSLADQYLLSAQNTGKQAQCCPENWAIY